MKNDAALVLFSGGQDSTVCLAWALQRYDRVETIGFDYGQRHRVELAQRGIVLQRLAQFADFGARLGDDTVLALPALAEISDTALTRDTEIAFAATGLPTTFVPGRNLLFLAYAAALAYRRGISTLVGGMCETDFSGYPDCRHATIAALADALALGLDAPIKIETPLMYVDKAGTWAMADEIGGRLLIDLIIDETHTCYLGDRTKRHDWGYGCGACPACELRANGFRIWRST
ncbi:MAG: 7-cyano-7-deazaguanine synthase QueC [Hyphomicrobium sp.]